VARPTLPAIRYAIATLIAVNLLCTLKAVFPFLNYRFKIAGIYFLVSSAPFVPHGLEHQIK
jgi:hypothetical protein